MVCGDRVGAVSIQDDLARIALQEAKLRFTHFDEAVAWSLGQRLRTMAEARKLAVVMDVRRFGQPLFYAAMAGTTPDNVEWVRRKSNVTARFLRSSYAIGLSLQESGMTLTEKYGVAAGDFVSHGGCFPIHVAQAGVIGSVTVSGLPQREDHEMVVEALCAELGLEYSSLRLE
jgi:uncharacterized protein (UPF0303 family)